MKTRDLVALGIPAGPCAEAAQLLLKNAGAAGGATSVRDDLERIAASPAAFVDDERFGTIQRSIATGRVGAHAVTDEEDSGQNDESDTHRNPHALDRFPASGSHTCHDECQADDAETREAERAGVHVIPLVVPRTGPGSPGHRDFVALIVFTSNERRT